MKLWSFVVSIFLISILFISVGVGFRNMKKLDEHLVLKREKVIASKFINKSFENTCAGIGFEDLNQWQKVCREMWKLEYIGWCNSEDFMVDKAPETGTLWYGKWIGCDTEGEIYFRSKRGDVQ